VIKNRKEIFEMQINITNLTLGGFTFADANRVFSKRKSYYLQLPEATLKFIVINSENNCHRALFRKLTDSQLALLKAAVKNYDNGLPLSASII